ncbi:hypothetical protein M9H77_16712 [Catharanthus roseus]|uniref:Uncharacterized protein n=1 Tax=Catharanthus roseus TaxID=4058 RepID=A0ACC0B2I4_CATRO|nr:hypothetical protein M9H77_16712 [Catharanthus roseus]
MNWTSHSLLDLKLRLMSRAQKKKLKLQENGDMVAYKEDTLKSKIEEFDSQGKLPKLLTMCSTIKAQSREQFGVWRHCCLCFTLYWAYSNRNHPTADGKVTPTVAGMFLSHHSGGKTLTTNDLELEIVILLYLVKEFQENYVRNGGNYMNMDERNYLNVLIVRGGGAALYASPSTGIHATNSSASDQDASLENCSELILTIW